MIGTQGAHATSPGVIGNVSSHPTPTVISLGTEHTSTGFHGRGVVTTPTRGSSYSATPVAAPTAAISPVNTAAVARTIGRYPILNTSVGNYLATNAGGPFANRFTLGRYGRNANVPQHRHTPPTLPGYYTPIVPFEST